MLQDYNDFLEFIEKTKSHHTVRSYKTAIVPFLEFFKIDSREKLQTITRRDIFTYRDTQLVPNVKENSTANARVRGISAFFGWLYDRELITENPCYRITALDETDKVPGRLTDEERIKVVNTYKKLDKKLMMAIMLYTGLRREEVVNIRVQDIKNDRLLVHGKGKREREIALLPFVLDLLNKYLKRHNKESEYLFPSHRRSGNITTESVRTRAKKAYRLAGIDANKIENLSAHSTRRTFACLLYENGVDIFTIQKALGHSNVRTTEKYLKGAKNKKVDEAIMNQRV